MIFTTAENWGSEQPQVPEISRLVSGEVRLELWFSDGPGLMVARNSQKRLLYRRLGNFSVLWENTSFIIYRVL